MIVLLVHKIKMQDKDGFNLFYQFFLKMWVQPVNDTMHVFY